MLSQANRGDDAEFNQRYVTIGVWLCTVAAALGYGALVRRRGDQPLELEERRTGRTVIGIVWTVALLAALRGMWLNGWIPSGRA